MSLVQIKNYNQKLIDTSPPNYNGPLWYAIRLKQKSQEKESISIPAKTPFNEKFQVSISLVSIYRLL